MGARRVFDEGAKVTGEFRLSAVVYNLRRVLNLRRVPEWLAAVRALAAAAGRAGPANLPPRLGRPAVARVSTQPVNAALLLHRSG